MITFLKTVCARAMSYSDYNELVQYKIAKRETTGNEQTQKKIDFTKLNASRSKRWDKTLVLSEKTRLYLENLSVDQTWLVITESWCGDAAHTLPVLNKIAEVSPNIDLKIVLRDENETLINEFLTNGTQSIPKLILLDQGFNVINTWGPRSQVATQLVMDYKKEHGTLDEAFKKELQIWYNYNKGISIVEDLVVLTKECQTSKGILE